MPAALRRMRWEIRPDRRAAQELRRAASTWIQGHGLPAGDAELVIAELLANAVRAARSTVVLELVAAQREVTVTVTDDGAGLATLPTPGLPAWEVEGSRGLYLVHELAKDVRLRPVTRGTSVTCRLTG